MRYLFLFLSYSFSLFSWAQFDESWSEEIQYGIAVLKVIPKEKDSYYVVTSKGNSAKDLKLFYFRKGKIMQEVSLTPSGEHAINRIEDLYLLKDNLVLFYSEESSIGSKLYAQYLDDYGQQKGKAILLTEQETKGSLNSKTINYNIRVAPNQTFFSVNFLYNNENVFEYPDLFTYTFNNELQLVAKATIKTEYYLSRLALDDIATTNNGDVLVLMKGFKTPSRSKLNYNSLDFYAIDSISTKKHYQLESGDSYFFDAKIRENKDNSYAVTYQYNTITKGKDYTGSLGIKSHTYKDSLLSKEQLFQFDHEELIQNLTVKERKSYDKATAKGKTFNIGLKNYRLRELNQLEDNSYLLLLEKSWQETRSYYTGRTYFNYVVYNYNDIKVMKYTDDFEKEYSVSIPKLQVSTDDYGYYSSYFNYLKDGKQLYLLFNDNVANYNSDGKYIAGNRPYDFTTNSNRFCTALIQFDVSTGTYQRNVLFDKNDVNTLFVPKLYEKDVLNNTTVLTFNKRNKFRFLSLFF